MYTCNTPFPILNLSVVPCLILTATFWSTCRLFRRKVRWFGTLISLRIFHSVLWSTQWKDLAWSVKQMKMFFWDSLAFSMIQWMLAIWSLVPQTSLYIWMFSVHVLLKLSLKDFEHYLASKWDEHSCMLGSTFFEIVFLLDWLKTDLFLHCGHYWVFQIADMLDAEVLYPHSLGCFKQLSWNSITYTSFVCSNAS